MSWYPVDPTRKCVQSNIAGIEFENFSCLYENSLSHVSTSYEKAYRPIVIRDKMAANPWIPITAIILYGFLIIVGRSYFASRKPWSWRSALALWNLSLSVFSCIGFCRVLPHLIHNFYHYSFTENFCFDPESMYGSDPVTGLWMQLFILSKFPYVVWLNKNYELSRDSNRFYEVELHLVLS
jgi:hypothetical protein